MRTEDTDEGLVFQMPLCNFGPRKCLRCERCRYSTHSRSQLAKHKGSISKLRTMTKSSLFKRAYTVKRQTRESTVTHAISQPDRPPHSEDITASMLMHPVRKPPLRKISVMRKGGWFPTLSATLVPSLPARWSTWSDIRNCTLMIWRRTLKFTVILIFKIENRARLTVQKERIAMIPIRIESPLRFSRLVRMRLRLGLRIYRKGTGRWDTFRRDLGDKTCCSTIAYRKRYSNQAWLHVKNAFQYRPHGAFRFNTPESTFSARALFG